MIVKIKHMLNLRVDFMQRTIMIEEYLLYILKVRRWPEVQGVKKSFGNMIGFQGILLFLLDIICQLSNLNHQFWI